MTAAHKVSTLANKALQTIPIPDPGPDDSFTFSFINAFAIIVPGKWTVAFDSTDLSTDSTDSLRWGDERLSKRGEYLPGYDAPSELSLATSGRSENGRQENRYERRSFLIN